ncbi:unnamed protein product [Rotaria magnacalcarata]|uniref:Uncharacterized protein n=2 Tax=Rotaria magnacalcarata TaxID=392030 RepID=A0A816ZBZ8_9BILA|nr:unnamed protein product [Rotaria magnacalcarata]CAF1450367.1 unnamed protein product [Rotaria magnacalcarata]CAF1965508.1 unnamed protein product [Rotaria magnacalcarata]CAF2091037.1 unnamed protein product [Rotaria magnacalcarata]CAF2197327.1 unnamed protein product [Rotaria magnacalcarata]
MRRSWQNTARIIILSIIMIWLFSYLVPYVWHYRSPTPMVYEADTIRYANATWPRRRIPRLIHQTYRTHDVPAIWNGTVQSVMEKNIGEFQYRRWSDIERDALVEKYEPHFYWNTYVNYPYDVQRIDSFRYVLMFHLGGIYIDMDNGCNRPFRELIATLEALDPDSPHLAAFPGRISFGVENDLIISTAGHPFHRQLISRLHYFNHHFILHFWTVLISTGPIYVSIQERFFSSSQQAVMRLLDPPVFRPIFTRKENGFSWVRKDTRIAFFLNDHSTSLLWLCKIFTFILILLVLYKKYKIKLRRS